MVAEKNPVIAQGRTAEIFPFGDGQVLKLFKDWCPAAMVEREAQTAMAVHKAGLPVPAVERIVERDGRRGIVFERVEGYSMGDVFKREPWKLFRLARLTAELQATMHSCELPELPSRRERLEENIRAVTALPTNTKEAVLKALDQLPDGNAVCHGDFYVDNIMISPRGPIIIDWFGAARGDPLADVDRTWLLNRLAYMRAGIPERWIINSIRALFHSAYLRRYLQLMPGSREKIAAWLLPVVAARLREDIPGENPRFLALVEELLSH